VTAAPGISAENVVFAVHGGAGGARRGEDGELAMREALSACLEEGRALLAGGAPALDAVERAVRRLEAHPLFNAGRGSVLTSEGRVEMDAAIMDGRTRAAGAVACVRRLAHPVSAARLVMAQSPHVLLVGDGAERFALARGAEAVDPDDLVTEQRRRQLAEALARGGVPLLDHDAPGGGGTVGAVARDAAGNLAAATSTGGLTGKLPGRVSDSALVGAGTWADDATCAVSATGHGEAFVRAALAHEVDAGLRLAGLALAGACERALARARVAGYRGGGLVALDRAGRCATPFDTPAMFRGWIAPSGPPVVRVFRGRS
jgi:isoaspartyl peptidase/L-asparaginase-like protein (Ntn-hydrolase superfamily)